MDQPMRLNKFIAQASGLSRRAADAAIDEGRVAIGPHKTPAALGITVTARDIVWLDDIQLTAPAQHETIMLHKPEGYVVSRNGQGSKTIYDILPPKYHNLKPVGRLDKDSSGLLILTNDGQLAQELTHPAFQKQKQYHVTLDAPLQPLHRQMISDFGIALHDGVSKLQLQRLEDGNDHSWLVTMHEGRNRQIRRTFESLGYRVVRLHRTIFGPYQLGDLPEGEVQVLTIKKSKDF